MAFRTSERAEAFRALEPEQRLLAAIVRRALRDARDARFPPGVRAQAAAFLAGGEPFGAWCALAEVDTGRLRAAIARSAAQQAAVDSSPVRAA